MCDDVQQLTGFRLEFEGFCLIVGGGGGGGEGTDVGMRLEKGIGRHGCRWVGCVCMERMDMDAGDTSRCSRTTHTTHSTIGQSPDKRRTTFFG